MNGEFDNTGYSATIKSKVEKIKRNDKWRREYMTLYLHEQKIMRKSREEGRTEERELAIRNMLKKLSPDEIIEMGYDRDLVMSIAEKN